ncbi:flagellar hook-basal body protein [Pseudalkalibacillus caeni]|uniref:Flagellar hook-basal body protein n=1 Tax=Exobacillus caeni TaxID=2574798 RepID=A0A5R9F2T6_9BACL|nr:flagellar hook-basal body protein [Pseudalkalibacillus caeni]TLS36626.1 flagellar hook-basal body protein [Pseudalkalibacillus caeni]
MFRGLYTATSGMMASERRQQHLTNNLSNASTPGYKQDSSIYRAFPEYLIQRMQGNKADHTPADPAVGSLNNGVYIQEGIPQFTQGALIDTGKGTDIAILDENLPIDPDTNRKGTLLFAAQLPNGDIRYTRNGNFSIDSEGYLATSEGYRILGENLQPIRPDSENFSLLANGAIQGSDASGARVWIGYTGEPDKLTKEGHGLFLWEGDKDTEPRIARTVNFLNGQFELKQGMLEGSNVDVSQTMTDMISTYRLFEANQKVLQAYDRSMEKTANDVGKVY